MKKQIIAALFMALAVTTWAQNETDALRYSLINYNGTARFTGMAGAYGAVGADFSSLSQNPAGLGMFRKSEVTITPVFSNSRTTATYLGNKIDDFRNTMYLGNLGYVTSIYTGDDNKIVRKVNFGVGMNQQEGFNNRMLIQGNNYNNTLVGAYYDDVLNSGAWDDFGSGLAFDTDLIYDTDTSAQTTNLQYDAIYNGVRQTKLSETYGKTRETALSLGFNIQDNLYIGTTFGFNHIKYVEENTFNEVDIADTIPYFKSMKKTDYLKTEGSGINMKFGIIYQPVDFLRLGLAVHTPTFFHSMHDEWNASITSSFDDGNGYTKDSPKGEYDYQLTTPARFIGSAAFIIGDHGLISADYEYVNYSRARLSASDYDFIGENQNIKAQYTSSQNFRLGAEAKLGIFAIRGGYGYYGSPYNINGTQLGQKSVYALGAGLRQEKYTIDFSYQLKSSEDNYYAYNIAPVADVKKLSSYYSLTLGYRF